MRRILALLVTAATLTSAPVARAEPLSMSSLIATSRKHYVEAQRAYREGRFEDALAELQAGYALSPRPEFLLNFAQTYRKLGRLEEAIVECKRFLSATPASALTLEASDLLIALRRQLADRGSAASPRLAPPRLALIELPPTGSVASPPTGSVAASAVVSSRPSRGGRPGRVAKWTALALAVTATAALGVWVDAGLQLRALEEKGALQAQSDVGLRRSSGGGSACWMAGGALAETCRQGEAWARAELGLFVSSILLVGGASAALTVGLVQARRAERSTRAQTIRQSLLLAPTVAAQGGGLQLAFRF